MAFPIAVIPAMILVESVFILFELAGVDKSGLQAPAQPYQNQFDMFIGTVIYGPIVETWLMGVGLKALSMLTSRTLFIATESAVAWGCLHASFGLMWLIGPTWSFFIFSCAYLACRKKSFFHSMIAGFIPHALTNATAMALQNLNPNLTHFRQGLLLVTIVSLLLVFYKFKVKDR